MIQLLEDNTGEIRAEIEITSISGDLYSGHIVTQKFTGEQIELFKEYENIVNNQALSILDEVENKIESFGFKLKNESLCIFDLQIWNMNKLSFRKPRPIDTSQAKD